MQRYDAEAERAHPHLIETGAAKLPGEGIRVRETPDRFDQILIAGAVPGDGLPKRRDHIEGITVIEPFDRRDRRLAELQTDESPAPAEHAEDLSQRNLRPGDVPDAEGNGRGIEAAIGEGQGHRIAPYPRSEERRVGKERRTRGWDERGA